MPEYRIRIFAIVDEVRTIEAESEDEAIRVAQATSLDNVTIREFWTEIESEDTTDTDTAEETE